MTEYKNVLLLKLPFCPHPDALSKEKEENFRTKAPFRPVPSLALAALAAFVERYRSFDYRLRTVDLNLEAYTQPGVPIDTSAYPGLLRRTLEEAPYDVLALSTMFIFNIRWVEEAVALSRRIRPQAKIILGGGLATLFPELCLQRFDIDDVVIGEGEATFLHLLNEYNRHSDPAFRDRFPFGGYARRGAAGVEIVPSAGFLDPADLPVPDWPALGVERYFANSGDRLLPIEGSRGCPYNCTYCCTYLSWGKKVRYKGVDQLLAEMREIRRQCPVEVLHFNDDNLGFRKAWLMEFLQRASGEAFDFKFSASNFSVKHLDAEVIDLLARVYGPGQFIGVAVETGSPLMQKRIQKYLDFDQIRQVVRMMKEKRLHVHLHWMVGFPNETIEQIRETFAFARELRAHSNQFLTVTPYPGTKLFEEARLAGLLQVPEDDFDNYDNRRSEYLKSSHWDYPQLQAMIYDANIEINFLNHPQLDDEEGRPQFLAYLLDLLKRLPEHIVAVLLVGHLLRRMGQTAEGDSYFERARGLFAVTQLCRTFAKYLEWDYPGIRDFRQYLADHRLEVPRCD